MELEILVKLLKKKDTRGLEYLYKEYSSLIFKVANGILNDRELSKEVTSDVFLKVWNNIKKFDEQYEKFPAWMMLITRYTAIDRLRKEIKHKNYENIDDINLKAKSNVETQVIAKCEVSFLSKEINNMNDIDKEIFIRRFYDDSKVSDIGKKMGITEKFINLRIFRGRKKLRERFQR